MSGGRLAGRRGSATIAERRERRAAVTDPEIVMEAAAAFLAVRQRSVGETRRRLLQLGYQASLVEGVLARLVEMRYLDDAEFARAWVESRDRARPRGEVALRRELALKGIDRDTVAAVLGDRHAAAAEAADRDGRPSDGHQPGSADLAAAERLLERRRSALLREPDLRKRRQRAYALLARNGFDPEVCRVVAARLAADADQLNGLGGAEAED